MPHLHHFASSFARFPIAAEDFQNNIPPAAIAEHFTHRNFTLTAPIPTGNLANMNLTASGTAIEFPINYRSTCIGKWHNGKQYPYTPHYFHS